MDRQELIAQVIELHQRLNRALRQYRPEAWIGLNLTIAQLKSLVFIDHEGCTNFRKLAAALEVTPSNLTGIVDRLVDQGLVSRQENPDDRRVLLLRTTEEGKAVLAKLSEKRASHLTEILADLSSEELTSLGQALATFCAAAEAHELKGAGTTSY
jgi:DNA-binding MarR family transcriptional regulator